MGDGQIVRIRRVLAAAVVGRNDTEKEIAFFNRCKAVLKCCAVREYRDRALVRHPDLVAKGRKQYIDTIQ